MKDDWLSADVRLCMVPVEQTPGSGEVAVTMWLLVNRSANSFWTRTVIFCTLEICLTVSDENNAYHFLISEKIIEKCYLPFDNFEAKFVKISKFHCCLCVFSVNPILITLLGESCDSGVTVL